MTTSRQINAIDATNGAAAIGDGARAVHVGPGGTYIEQQTVVIQERPCVEPNLFQVPFPRSAGFVGREDDLACLHDLLNMPERPLVGIVGMGGIGKTRLILEYTRLHTQDYDGGVYWINASDFREWPSEMGARARGLDLHVEDSQDPDATMKLVQQFAGYLSSHPNSLLILDNVEDYLWLTREVVPGVRIAALRCHVVFTTRRRQSDPDDAAFALLPIQTLPMNAALEILLRARGNSPSDPEYPVAIEICESLGCLPLALVLAGAYLARFPQSLTLSSLKKRIQGEGGVFTVENRRVTAADHELGVLATLQLQYKDLDNPGAHCLLQTLALLDEAEQVPLVRIKMLSGLAEQAVRPGYPAPWEEALQDLAQSCLVDNFATDQLGTHPLIRDFVRHQMPDLPGFARQALQHFVDGIRDLKRLQDQVESRGIDAVLEDLQWVLQRVAVQAGECPWISSIRWLSRVLKGERRFLAQHPELLGQQVANRASQHNSPFEVEYKAQTPWFKLLSGAPEHLNHDVTATWRAAQRVAFSPDGQLAWLITHEGTVVEIELQSDRERIVWEKLCPDCQQFYTGHWRRLALTCVGRDGRWLIGLPETGEILQDSSLPIEDGQIAACLDTGNGLLAVITYSSQKTAALIHYAPYIGGIYATRIADLGFRYTLDAPLALSKDRRYAACRCGSEGRDVVLVDLARRRIVRVFSGHDSWVSCCCLIDEWDLLLTGTMYQDGMIRTWDLSTGALKDTFSPFVYISDLKWSPKHKALITLGLRHSTSPSLCIYNYATGGRPRCISLAVKAYDAFVSPDESQFAVTGESTTLVFSLAGLVPQPNVANDSVEPSIPHHHGEVAGIHVLHDGKVATVSEYGECWVWDLENHRPIRRLDAPGVLRGSAISPDERHVAICSRNSTTDGTELYIYSLMCDDVIEPILGPIQLKASDVKAYIWNPHLASLEEVAPHTLVESGANKQYVLWQAQTVAIDGFLPQVATRRADAVGTSSWTATDGGQEQDDPWRKRWPIPDTTHEIRIDEQGIEMWEATEDRKVTWVPMANSVSRLATIGRGTIVAGDSLGYVLFFEVQALGSLGS